MQLLVLVVPFRVRCMIVGVGEPLLEMGGVRFRSGYGDTRRSEALSIAIGGVGGSACKG
jgi:hypothetical protein